MSKLIAKSEYKNYLAKVVKLGELRKHPGADKLQIVNIDGQNVITGLGAKKDDVYIYFPLESQLNFEYLSWSNSFAKAELNTDKAIKGFFPSVGRVKTAKLRGLYSEGYIIPVKSLVEWLSSVKIKVAEENFEVGIEFSHIGDTLICDKYINHVAVAKARNQENNSKKKGAVKRESKLIDNQFRLHIDTAAFKKNLHNISPDNLISISEKIHGTSAVFGKVLCKKPLKWHEKALKKLGINIIDFHYDYVYSSRKVIKNQYADKVSLSYYKEDVWSLVAKTVNPFLKDGMTFYAEIYGQLPSGSWIQKMKGKGYDYGTKPLEYNYAIYRITSTNVSGEVIEFTDQQIVTYCNKYALNHVPYHYMGYARDLFPSDLSKSKDDRDLSLWREELLKYLVEKFTEMDCPMCANKVPREGIVIRKHNDYPQVYKLKSLRFIAGEADDAEAGEVDVETQESTQ